MDIRKTVGANLRRVRVAQKLTQEDLAGKAEVDNAHLSRIERGEENASIVFLDKLAKKLNVPIGEFFKEFKKGDPLPEPLRAGRKPKSPKRK